jgi:hypothetical protein
MSIGSLGIIGSAAGTPLSQAKGTETDKAAQSTSDQARQVQSDRHAEAAAGIGQTEQDEQASDRDADGRRPWEIGGKKPDDDEESANTLLSKDPTGEKGNQLDLSG